MPIHPTTVEKLEENRQQYHPNIPQEAYLAFENFLFFMGL